MWTKSKILLLIIMLGLIQPLFAQEDILKAYADTSCKKSYCFYPSTLRMLNLAKNQDYYDMVEDVEKLLVYILDSAAMAEKSYTKMLAEYRKNGFAEYAVVTGGSTDFYIIGKDGNRNEIAGVFSDKKRVFAFYLTGQIGWQKIPALVQSFDKSDMFNLFDLSSTYAK